MTRMVGGLRKIIQVVAVSRFMRLFRRWDQKLTETE